MATYKVRNSAGKEFEVDDNKVNDAEKDGFLPVVSNGSQEHRVSFSDLPKAAKDGYSPLGAAPAPKEEEGKSVLQGVEDSETNAFASQIGRNVPIVGPAMVKAGHGVAALLGSLTPEDFKKPELRNKTIGEVYDYLEAEDAKKQDKVYDEHPISATAGNLAGSSMLPGPGTGMKGLAGIATRIGGNAALNAADTAVRTGDLDKTIDSAETGAGVSAAIEALPYVGKAAKFAKRFVPGTENALPIVNKATAKGASLMPFQSASAGEINTLLSETGTRKAARGLNMTEEAGNLREPLADAISKADTAVGNKFSDLEKKSLEGSHWGEKDVNAFEDLLMDVHDQVKGNTTFEKFYGPKVKKLNDLTTEILAGGGPKEIGAATVGKSPSEFFEEVYKSTGDLEQATKSFDVLAKKRVLNARRNLDDFMRSKNWENLNQYEREAIGGLRDTLNTSLKQTFTGAAERRQADELFSSWKKSSGDLFDPLTSRSPSGARELDTQKIESLLKSGTGRGAKFDERLSRMDKFLEDAAPQLGELPEVRAAMEHLNELRVVGKQKRLNDTLERAGGGPTSQILNFLAQGVGAVGTNGLSLVAMPITNPAGFTRMLDAADAASKPILEKLKVAAQAIMKANPQIATRLYMLSQGQDK